MADIKVTGEKPGVTSYEDFDVFSGKSGISRSEYKEATFHNSETNSDAVLSHKAQLMGASVSELESVGSKAAASIKTEKGE